MLLQLLKNIDTKANKVKVFVRGKKQNTYIEDEIQKYGVDIIYLNLDEVNILIRMFRFIRMLYILKKFNPDIIHTHLEYFYSFVYARLFNKKIVATIHSWPTRFLNRKNRFMFKKLLKKKLLKVVCCAKCVEKAFKEEIEIDDEYITTIYNPLDLKMYKYKNNKNTDFSLVHVGRLTEIKNQELLIRSFDKVLSQNANIYLNIVGDGELKRQLMDLTKQLKIENNIKFWGNRDDVHDILSKSDAFILTSKIECCPMVILEAMATGLPCISTNVGGTAEIIGNAGILCDEDSDSISQAILEIANDKNKYKKYHESAIKRSKLFDSRIISTNYFKLYENVLGK